MPSLKQSIYDGTVNDLLSKISEEDREIVKGKYKEYVFKVAPDEEEPTKFMVKGFIETYKKSYEDPERLRNLLNLLMIDESYIRLWDIRAEIARKLDEEASITEDEYNSYVEEIKNLKESVRDYNKEIIGEFTDNMLIDLDFLAGKSNSVSIDNAALFWRGKARELVSKK